MFHPKKNWIINYYSSQTNFRKRTQNFLIDDVEDENDINNSSSKQRLDFKLVKNYIVSYVMSMISVKSTNSIVLEKSCLPKIKNSRDWTFISNDRKWLS